MDRGKISACEFEVVGDAGEGGNQSHKGNFDDWHSHLREFMGKKKCHDGIALNPDDWCGKEEWKRYFLKGMTIKEAYDEEC